MNSKHRKHGWAFWLIVALIGLPVLYVASFGPTCWWLSRELHVSGGLYVLSRPEGARIVSESYWPIGWLAIHGPPSIGRALGWYGGLRDPKVYVPVMCPA